MGPGTPPPALLSLLAQQLQQTWGRRALTGCGLGGASSGGSGGGRRQSAAVHCSGSALPPRLQQVVDAGHYNKFFPALDALDHSLADCHVYGPTCIYTACVGRPVAIKTRP